jgi:hypothetical protein
MALNCFQVANNDRQKVIEVVRDTPGQLPDTLHLLCLFRPLVSRSPLGQIPGYFGKA